MMDILVSWVSYLLAAFATIPFLTFFIVYIVVYRLTENQKRAFRLSMDVTTALLIMAVGALLQYVTGTFASWWMTLGLLLVFYLLHALLQIWVKGTIDWKRLGQRGWRMSFILFGILYVILFVIGVGQTFFAHR